MRTPLVLCLVLFVSACAGCAGIIPQPVFDVPAAQQQRDIQERLSQPWFPVDFMNWGTEPASIDFTFGVIRFYDPNRGDPFVQIPCHYHLEIEAGGRVRVNLPPGQEFQSLVESPGHRNGFSFNTRRDAVNIFVPRLIDMTPAGSELLNRTFSEPFTYQVATVTFENRNTKATRLTWMEKSGLPRIIENKGENDNAMWYERRLVYEVVPRNATVPPGVSYTHDFPVGEYSVAGNVDGIGNGSYDFVVTGNGQIYDQHSGVRLGNTCYLYPDGDLSVDAVKIPTGFDQFGK